MNLKQQITKDTIQAMKDKASQKLDILRYLNAQIIDQEIAQGRRQLTGEQLIGLINNQIKKLEEGIELFKKGGREDLVEKNLEEIKILKAYLPAQISDKELEKEIDKIIADNPQITQPGPLICIAVKKLSGKADNSRISKLILSKLKK